MSNHDQPREQLPHG